jgi:RNA polymerase sigma factor (sigma-70 family)
MIAGEISAPGTADDDADPLPGWVAAAAAGDPKAWDQLVDHFGGLIWSVCRSHRLSDSDAADVTQLTWLRLLENLDRIRDPRRLGGWLVTTCRRECLGVLRRSKTTMPTADDFIERLLGESDAPDQRILMSDEYATLWQAFRRLGEWCQQVLKALIVDPEEGPPSYRVVAAQLQTRAGSLGPTRARCLAQLRKLLDGSGI